VVKTWKIGEYAMGGIIRVSTKPRGVFSVECIDWDTKEIIQWRYVHGYDELTEHQNIGDALSHFAHFSSFLSETQRDEALEMIESYSPWKEIEMLKENVLIAPIKADRPTLTKI